MTLEIPHNQILNPSFMEGLRHWSHSDDVTVTEFPMLPPDLPDGIHPGRCVELGPGGELGQFLGFMPTPHNLHFLIHADDATEVNLAVTVSYTDRDLNVTDAPPLIRTDSDYSHDWEYGGLRQIDVPLERDTWILQFNVVNNASEGEAPVYLGLFNLRVEYPDYGTVIPPRGLWSTNFVWQLIQQNREWLDELLRSRTPLPMNAMSSEGKMLATQIFHLERKLARLTKRLGLQEEESKTRKPKPRKEKKEKHEELV